MNEIRNQESQKMRVLVTGGAGFIGSHLSEELLRCGHQVTVIDDLSTGQFANIEHLATHPNFRFAIDTITNEIVLDRLASECDVIFHLAAAVGVMLIVERPVHTIETNVMGTEAVLKAALRYRAKVILTSTSEVYGKGNRVPFKEDDDVVLGPTTRSRWAYAASKMVDEFLGLAYFREKGLPVVIGRLFNTVGQRQSGAYGMVIPRFVEQALRGEAITIYGNGEQSRCFMDVKDTVQALISLAHCQEAVGQVFNIGGTEEVSIKDLACKILELTANFRNNIPNGNFENAIIYIPYEEAYAVGFEDMVRRVPDTTKLQQFTGWTPKYNLEETLEGIIQQFALK